MLAVKQEILVSAFTKIEWVISWWIVGLLQDDENSIWLSGK